MPVLTRDSAPQIVDLAERLSADLRDGRSARESFGSRDVAFAWTTGLPPILATAVSNAVVDGRSFNAITAGPSGTPVAKVTEGGTKPTAVTLKTTAVTLEKFAGLGTFSTEQAIGTEGLVFAVYQTLAAGALLAFDTATIAKLAADADVPDVTGASWSAAILAGVASVYSRGGTPDVLVMSGADYAAAVESPGTGYLLDPRSGVQTLFGLRIVVASGATPGTAFVLDGAAVTCVESSTGPICVIDPYSGLSTNAIRIACEFFAAAIVNAPGSVASVTVAP